MKTNHSPHSYKPSCFRKHKLALAIAAQLWACHTWAGPTGGEIVGGDGRIEQSGHETTITQRTDRLAIDWQSFNVAEDERVHFIQPDQRSVALNRILGGGGSEIMGRIDANGHVMLVNPQGIVFGESATLDVGGLVASGLQIDAKDFLNGDLVFQHLEGTGGTVINSGTINASLGGNVALLGSRVENRGLISAQMGRVQLAAGTQAVLNFDGDGLLGVQVDDAMLQEVLGDEAAIVNSGEIYAAGGQILLSASASRDVFSQAVNWGDYKQARSVTYNDDGSFALGGANVENSGTLDVSAPDDAGAVVVLGENVTHSGDILANTEAGQGGHIELHAATTTQITGTGSIKAQGRTGGDVAVLGHNVGLFDDAQVSATGIDGGGTALIGGGREGLNPAVPNAEFAYIGEETSIDVSALNSGDGGTAIIFAEDTTRVYGKLSARGGIGSGNGGFIETSGKRGFEIVDSPDIAAPNGIGGHWLIDPYNIIIDSQGDLIFDSENIFESTFNNSRISVNTINSALSNMGAIVTLKTGSGGNQEGNIIFNSDLNFTGGVRSTLNLIAHNDILFTANITANRENNSQLNLHLHANLSSDPDSTGSIQFNNTPTISTNGGNFQIGHINDNGTIDTSLPGTYDVDFSNVTIDVTGRSYYDLGLFEIFFSNRTPAIAGNDRQYLSGSGRIVVNASHNVNLGGSDGTGSDNGTVTMNVRGRERENEDNFEKIYIIAGNNILLDEDRVWTYDNNPTEIFEPGQNPNDGFTTLRLEADGDIHLAGDITYAWDQESGNTRQEQNDRLMIDLSAGGNVALNGNIDTAGGHFSVRDAMNVDFSGQRLDTGSRYGAGDLRISATGDITLGNTPMFNGTAGSLRTPSLHLNAGGEVALGSDDITVSGTDIYLADNSTIYLAGSSIDFNSRSLSTVDGGDITLISGSDVTLPQLDVSGDLTVAALDDQAQSIDVRQNQALQVVGASRFRVGEEGNITLTAENLLQGPVVFNSAHNVTLQVSSPNDGDNTPDTPFWLQLGHEDFANDNQEFASHIYGDLQVTVIHNGGVTNPGALEVLGSTRIHADGSPVFLDNAGNAFTGPVLVGDDDSTSSEVRITTQGDLQLGHDDHAFSVNGNLDIRAGGNITQLSELSVDGIAQFSAGADVDGALGEIDLSHGNNQLHTLVIDRAGHATITNSQTLVLNDISETEHLDLRILGSVSQIAALDINELTLDVTGQTTLTHADNQIGTLSGTLNTAPLNLDVPISNTTSLTTQSPLNLGDLTLNGATHIRASEVRIENSTVQLNNSASLNVTDVTTFILNGNIHGANDNSVSVVGAAGSSEFRLGDDLTLNQISLLLDGGSASGNSLYAANLDNTWSINSTEAHQLNGIVAFDRIQHLNGGTGNDFFSFDSAANTGLFINGGGGDLNQVSYAQVQSDLEVTLGDTTALLQNIHQLEGNADSDSVYDSLLRVTGAGDYRWDINAENAGQVGLDGSVVTVFQGFNQLYGGPDNNHFEIDANLLGENAYIQGGPGGNTFQVNTFQVNTNFSGSLTGNIGDDIFILDGAISGHVNGGDGGRNRFYLTENTRLSASLDGGGGDSQATLVGINEQLTWNIAPDADGNLSISVFSTETTPPPTNDDAPPGAPEPLRTYLTGARGISALEGGIQDDQFIYFQNAAALTVDGGGGTNTADYSQAAEDISVTLGSTSSLGLSNIQRLVGNGAQSTLEGPDTGATWTVSEENGGQVTWPDQTTVFEGFAHLHGGAGDDAFELGALVQSISGGGGHNIVDAANLNQDLQVHLEATTLTAGVLHLEQVQDITADASFDNRLFSAAEDNHWAITGTNQGTVQNMGQGDATLVEFHHFAYLQGQQDNRFEVAPGGALRTVEDTPGQITGGNGDNRLLALTGRANHWLVDGRYTGALMDSDTNTAAGSTLRFVGVQHLEGHDDTDTFTLTDAAAQVDSLNGGSGNNHLRVLEGENTWRIEQTNQGILNVDNNDNNTAFLNIAHLTGGSGHDTFIFEQQGHITGLLQGGTGLGTVNMQAVDQGINANLQTGTINIGDGTGQTTLQVSNIHHWRANPQHDNRFTGLDQNGYWQWSDVNTGQVHYSAPPEAESEAETPSHTTLSFDGFQTVRGGSGDDLFDLHGYWAGRIEGGGGHNQLHRGNQPDGDNGTETPYVWHLEEPNGGNLTGQDPQLDFVQIAELVGAASEDHFVFAPNGALTGSLDGGSDTGNRLTYRRPQHTWVQQVDAGTGEPAFHRVQNPEGDTVLAFTRIQDWHGSGNDRLQGADQNQEWRLDGLNRGTIELFEGPFSEIVNAEPQLTFEGFSDLQGGAGYDTFRLAPQGNVDGFLAAGPGGGALHIEHNTSVAVNVAHTPTRNLDLIHSTAIYATGFTHIEATATGNKLYGPSEHEEGYTWLIDDRYGGRWTPTAEPEPKTETTFKNFAHLEGGDRNDRFQILEDGQMVSIHGGGGENFMDHSATEGDITLIIGQGAGTDNSISIFNIQGLVGNNDGTGTYQATLLAPNGLNLWTIEAYDDTLTDGINDGVFEQRDPNTNEVRRVRFQNFSRLVGDGEEDTFILRGDAWVSGGIFGGRGENTLEADGLTETRRLTLALMPEPETEPTAADISLSNANQLLGPGTQFFAGIDTVIGANNQTTLQGLDSANQWRLNGHNTGILQWSGGQLTYENVGHLQGGQGADRFILNDAGGLSGWISGGGGDNSLYLATAATVHLADTRAALAEDAATPALRILPDVGTLTTEVDGDHHLHLHTLTTAEPQQWQITGGNSGQVLGVDFSGFTHLRGSAGDDRFEFSANGALTGVLHGGGGHNTVDLTTLDTAVSVALGEGADAALQLRHIHSLTGNPEWDNRLHGSEGNNNWRITESDGGTLSHGQDPEQSLRFSHFPILIGGAGEDRFELTDNGLVTGHLDGGGGTANSLDFSILVPSLDVLVHDDSRPEQALLIRNLQHLNGNNRSQLIGPNANSHWLLDDGTNQGQLSFDNNPRHQLTFAGFSDLQGGDSDNHFELRGGAVTGQILGGGGGRSSRVPCH